MDDAILVSGTGSIGTRHAQNLQTLGATNLSLCDPASEELETLGKELNAQTFTDFSEALATVKPKIVFVCSPTKYHVAQALEAAKAGAHLFIEKPLSYTFDQVEELKKEVDACGVIAMVGCNMRFHHGPATVKKLLDEGRIGSVKQALVYTGSYLPNWRHKQDYRLSYSADPNQGGAILDCIHELDLALWYFGPAKLEKAVLQPATPIEIPVTGTADITLQHESGTKSEVHLSFMEKEYTRFCNITGTEGSIHWDINEGKVDVKNPEGNVVDSYPQPESYEFGQAYIDEIAYFLDCVENNNTPEGNLDDAIRALTIALEAKTSA